MPSDAISRPQSGMVSLTECDGRYRVYQHGGHGMYYLAAFTRQSDKVTRMLYGVDLAVGLFVVFYNREADAQAKADRLNLKV